MWGKSASEYGARVEWYWQGKTEVLEEKPFTVSVVDERMSTEHWWNDTDSGKPKYWEKKIILWVEDEWLCMEKWWNDNDGGKLKYWRKILYSVGGR